MKFFSLVLLYYIALITQLGLIPNLTVAGNRANLMLVVLCLALFWLRDAQVFLWAVLTGLVCEAFDDAHPGTGVLILTGLIWLAYRVQVQLELRSLFSRCTLIAGVTFAFESLFPILNRTNWNSNIDLSGLLQRAAGNALYSALAGLLLLFCFKIMQSVIPVPGRAAFTSNGAYTSRYSH